MYETVHTNLQLHELLKSAASASKTAVERHGDEQLPELPDHPKSSSYSPTFDTK